MKDEVHLDVHHPPISFITVLKKDTVICRFLLSALHAWQGSCYSTKQLKTERERGEREKRRGKKDNRNVITHF